MPTTLTAEMEKAYAANPAGEVVFETLEFDHSTFDEPARIVCNAEEDMTFPLAAGGPDALFKAIGVDIVLPGAGEDGPTPMRLHIENGSSYLLPYCQLAVQTTQPITVVYRSYTTTDLTKPGDVIPGFELRNADLSSVVAEATVGFPEIELQAFPLPTYDAEYFPALQGN